jgi:hypothetical protein
MWPNLPEVPFINAHEVKLKVSRKRISKNVPIIFKTVWNSIKFYPEKKVKIGYREFYELSGRLVFVNSSELSTTVIILFVRL